MPGILILSVPFGPNVLSFADITEEIRCTFASFTDARRGKNTQYTLVDAGLSAFSVFFMQSPSFLEYQRSLEQAHGRNNAQTLFGVHAIPSDNQIRTLLDATEPERLKPLFDSLFQSLQQAGVLDIYRDVNHSLLVALDGTDYFSSKTIHCPNCSTREHANGQVRFFHTALTPVLVKPGLDKVIALAPEFVRPQDGAEKQDCELNAAKRWLAESGAALSPLNVTLLGDDLFCHEPFCRQVLGQGLNFILVCKPSSHTTVDEWLAFLQRSDGIRTLVCSRWTGRRHETDTYRYVQTLPLCDGKDALTVNWCEITTTDEHGKVLYRNSFATSWPLNDKAVVEVAAAGRSRWKIENESNNVLKTKGYHFEHNYGHGQQHLAAVLASLIILAFLVHTVLEWMDDQYQLLRQKLPSRQRLFSDIRTLSSYLCFNTWVDLMTFMLKSFEPAPPAKPRTG